MLLRDGRAVPLIPKYFDLLCLLLRQRREAVRKDAIFAEVWSDVVVSDGALAQAVRTLRRTLGDDVREPRFIRTVSRHGYQFVWRDVVEEPDEDDAPPAPAAPEPLVGIEPLVDRLMRAADQDEARDVAEQLHTIGTAEAVAAISARPHHAPAMAVLRDARWAVPDAGAVPILGDAEAAPTIVALVRLRLSSVTALLARRWWRATGAGAVGGALAGSVGGGVLLWAPGSAAHVQSVIALAAIGALAGAVGSGGIAAGLGAAEVLARSRRTWGLVACAALSGGIVAAIAGAIARALLRSLFGVQVEHPGGALEGAVLGAAAALGYSLTTSPEGGGMAAPHGSRRALVTAAVAGSCAAGAIVLAALDRPLIGGLVHEIARLSRNAELGLEPLGRLIGEPDFGYRTRLLLSGFEGACLGAALALGLTRRPSAP